MSENENTTNEQDTPVTLRDMLAASGYRTKESKTRLPYGAHVANAFTDANVQDVIVLGTEATDAYIACVAELTDKFPGLLVLKGSHATTSIRSHLERIGKTKNVAWTDKTIGVNEGVPVGGVDNVPMGVHVSRK